MSAAATLHDVTKRYGKRTALEQCSLEIPAGSVTALVGPNGAGKTTMLQILCGLLSPTSGEVRVLGADPGHDAAVIARIGFVAQEQPLYRSLTVRDTMRFGAATNPRWDQLRAVERLDRARVPLDQRVGELSGGQRAQVALALALGKRPELLLLDEPLASLDPLARREFLASLMETAADGGITIVLSSHLITDLERVCDHLIVLAHGDTQVSGSIAGLMASHRTLVGPRQNGTVRLAGVSEVIERTDSERETTLIARLGGPLIDSAWSQAQLGLEDLVLAYLARPAAPRVVVPAREPEPVA